MFKKFFFLFSTDLIVVYWLEAGELFDLLVIQLSDADQVDQTPKVSFEFQLLNKLINVLFSI